MDSSISTQAPEIDATLHWLDRAVIGLNLCPFAGAVRRRNAIRVVCCPARDVVALQAALQQELVHLAQSDPQELETTLLVHPRVLNDFHEYNDFLDIADATVVAAGLEGVVQVASFHPDYCFADSPPDAVENHTNRSPHPMLHLLRESSVERAVESHPDIESIYETNIQTLRRIGLAGWHRMLAGE
jgi:uncharacterized protein